MLFYAEIQNCEGRVKKLVGSKYYNWEGSLLKYFLLASLYTRRILRILLVQVLNTV